MLRQEWMSNVHFNGLLLGKLFAQYGQLITRCPIRYTELHHVMHLNLKKSIAQRTWTAVSSSQTAQFQGLEVLLYRTISE